MHWLVKELKRRVRPGWKTAVEAPPQNLTPSVSTPKRWRLYLTKADQTLGTVWKDFGTFFRSLFMFRPSFGFLQSCRSRNFLLGEPVKKNWARICVELWHFSISTPCSVFLRNPFFRLDLDKSSTDWFFEAYNWIRMKMLVWTSPFSGRMARTLSIL